MAMKEARKSWCGVGERAKRHEETKKEGKNNYKKQRDLKKDMFKETSK